MPGAWSMRRAVDQAHHLLKLGKAERGGLYLRRGQIDATPQQ